MSDDSKNTHNCTCSHNSGTKSVEQSLEELEFERGIWNAAIYNEVGKVRDFIRKGKAMERDQFGYTALHYAARQGNEEICRMLIESGHADVNAITKGGATPLHRAAMMGHLKIVEILTNARADVTIQDSDGQTALHRAALKGFLSISKQLLQISINIKTIKDKNNHVPYDLIPINADDNLKLLLKP